jgi:hypothetical protein
MHCYVVFNYFSDLACLPLVSKSILWYTKQTLVIVIRNFWKRFYPDDSNYRILQSLQPVRLLIFPASSLVLSIPDISSAYFNFRFSLLQHACPFTCYNIHEWILTSAKLSLYQRNQFNIFITHFNSSLYSTLPMLYVKAQPSRSQRMVFSLLGYIHSFFC